MPRVELKDITAQNFDQCVKLKVGKVQETFVAANVMSIAQSKIYPTMNIFAVYSEDEMVGFTMFGRDSDDDRYYLVRLMVDEKHQGKGYGRAAVIEVVERMRRIEDCRELFLSFIPENTAAEKLYSSIGFERTGEINQGEIVMRYVFDKPVSNAQSPANN